MAKRPTDDDTGAEATLRHNPFASLAKSHGFAAKSPGPQAAAPPKPVGRSSEPRRPLVVRVRLESRGRSGKVVTRITGLPRPNLEAIAARVRSALGCGGGVEGDDVVLDGSLADRTSEWLRGAGELHDICDAPARARPADVAPEPLALPGEADESAAPGAGTRRADIRRGARVAIVLKADQATGKLTEGVVRDILTSSPTHHRGIKVRLETGEVGRVKLIRP